MVDLTRLSVAGQLGAADPAIAASGLTVRVCDPAALYLVTGAGPDLAPNQASGADPTWLWLAPDRRLLVGEAARPAEPEGGFVSDVADGQAVFELTGERVADLLAMGCTLDANGPDLAPGRCAQTVFAGVKVLLYAHQGRGCIRMHVERPVAGFLFDWLRQAATAFG
jgi:heterotetrameric sarcosine oxidase gamma subunit